MSQAHACLSSRGATCASPRDLRRGCASAGSPASAFQCLPRRKHIIRPILILGKKLSKNFCVIVILDHLGAVDLRNYRIMRGELDANRRTMRRRSAACRPLPPGLLRHRRERAAKARRSCGDTLRARPHAAGLMREKIALSSIRSGAHRDKGYHATRACFFRPKACQYAPSCNHALGRDEAPVTRGPVVVVLSGFDGWPVIKGPLYRAGTTPPSICRSAPVM